MSQFLNVISVFHLGVKGNGEVVVILLHGSKGWTYCLCRHQLPRTIAYLRDEFSDFAGYNLKVK